MIKFLFGAISMLLFVAAGFFLWKSRAENEDPVPAAPDRASYVSPLQQPLPIPPAAPAKSKEEKRFARADRDDDGRITRAELMQPRQKAFAKLDRDGNGSLSFEEWAVKTGDKFAGADKDRSGFLTPAEFASTAPKPRKKTACSC